MISKAKVTRLIAGCFQSAWGLGQRRFLFFWGCFCVVFNSRTKEADVALEKISPAASMN